MRRLAVAGLLLALTSAAARPETPGSLLPLLSQIEAYLHRGEAEGVTLDPRKAATLAEQMRLSVVPQMLGACELYALKGRRESLDDVVQRADFLCRGIDAYRCGDASDGMLAYAFLRAFEVTGNVRYRDAADPLVAQLLSLDVSQERLNRGLMAALGLALHARLSADGASLERVHEIIALVAREQHADGSFPHTCAAGHDVHYTAWMAVELRLLRDLVDDLNIDRILTGTRAFLDARLGPDGIPSYEQPVGGTTLPFYSKAACPDDYETRGWSNELAYHSFLFDGGDPRFVATLERLRELESQGGIADKWAYPPDPSDPYREMSTAKRSVIRSSLVFWVLAEVAARETVRGPFRAAVSTARTETASATEQRSPELSLAPNPAPWGSWIALRTTRAGRVELSIADLAGRRVATLFSGDLPAGETRVRWDGLLQQGGRAPAGIYWVRLAGTAGARTERLVLLP